MITVEVKFDDGNSLTTDINTTLEGARDYYLGNVFNLGVEEDHLATAVSVEEI